MGSRLPVLIPELFAGEHITAVKHEVISTEEKPVTLSCSYDASWNYPLLYWYKLYPNQAPQFLLYKGAKSSTREHIPDKRYTSKTSQTTTELIIQHLTLADTALYYCALRDDTQ
uniref:Ig-like domain-containing protein n=1 Tax=Hucho hucho TaxID=62062 RepID=A0A4W5L0W7_9TELE